MCRWGRVDGSVWLVTSSLAVCFLAPALSDACRPIRRSVPQSMTVLTYVQDTCINLYQCSRVSADGDLCMTSRRNFLKASSAAMLAAGATHSVLAWAADHSAISVPGKESMIVRSYRFLDLETPVELMTDWITPVKHFFV